MREYMRKQIRLFIRRMRRSRWYRTIVLRFSAVTLFSLISIPVLLSLFFSHPAEANDGSEVILYKYYHRIEVEEGDTLWSIAKENYTPCEQTIQEYIAEVEQINHCTNGIIYAGEYLMIPYYSSEFQQ